MVMIFVSDTYVLTVQAQDDDSPTSDAGKIDYSINTGAFGKFVIDSKSGNISTSADATFDFDVKNQYVMQVCDNLFTRGCHGRNHMVGGFITT